MAKAKDQGEWKDIDRSDGYYIITANEGPGGSGKSHFALTAPEPLYVHLFDPGGLNGLKKNPLFKKKDIKIVEYNADLSKVARNDRQEYASEIIERFKENQKIALRDARTIVWDKEERVWQLLRFSYFGASSDRPNSYDEPNMDYQGFFHDVEIAGKNLCAVRGLKERWGNKASAGGTGEFDGRGHKEVPELVQVVLRHRWDQENKAFVTTVHEKCRVGEPKKLLGKEYVDLTFRELGEKLYPETADMDDSPWE